jgi:multidrug efflux pump
LMEIDFTFAQGTDPNVAQVQVENNLSLAEALLPSVVTQQGIKVKKSAKSFMLVVGLVSADGSMSAADISDYIASHLQDPLTRIPGVGDFNLFGTEYAMRIWLDPDKLYKYSLTVGDVTSAISAQNVQVSSGELGGVPARKGQRLDATVVGPSRFQEPGQFESILLKVNQDGSQVRLRDVARVEVGAQAYTPTSLYNGEPASAIALKLSPGANQLSTEAAVKAELGRLSRYFPPGLKIVYPFDTEPFITLSLTEVVKTLFEAVALVFVVMFVFLQNFRATLIPTIAVPIVLLGTFAVLACLGYSINTLTMLAMVLGARLLRAHPQPGEAGEGDLSEQRGDETEHSDLARGASGVRISDVARGPRGTSGITGDRQSSGRLAAADTNEGRARHGHRAGCGPSRNDGAHCGG